MRNRLAKNENLDPSQRNCMQAAILAGPGKIRMEQVQQPMPGAGEVRVRMLGCGICGSNLGPWAGAEWMQFPAPPGEPGHEGWGIIDAVGEDVEDLAVGDPVATLFYRSFAEFDCGPASSAVRLPESLRGKEFPGEPLACAMNIFRRCGIAAGQSVAILGIGFMGALLTRLAAQAGAEVIAVSRRPYALNVARDMGASHCLTFDEAAAGRIGALTGGCDRVIEAAGVQAAIDLATEISAVRGRLIMAGYHQDGLRQVNMQQWNWKGLDVINAHERDPAIYRQGLVEAIEAVEDGRIELEPLLTHRFPLHRVAEGLDTARDRPDGFLKAVVTIP